MLRRTCISIIPQQTGVRNGSRLRREYFSSLKDFLEDRRWSYKASINTIKTTSQETEGKINSRRCNTGTSVQHWRKIRIFQHSFGLEWKRSRGYARQQWCLNASFLLLSLSSLWHTPTLQFAITFRSLPKCGFLVKEKASVIFLLAIRAFPDTLFLLFSGKCVHDAKSVPFCEFYKMISLSFAHACCKMLTVVY